jgi:hypothetical protein
MRELEPAADGVMGDLINRPHLLNYYMRRWTPVAKLAPPPPVTKPSMMIAAPVLSGLLLSALMLGALAVFGLGKISVPNGAPLGRSVRTTNYIATLISTLVPTKQV